MTRHQSLQHPNRRRTALIAALAPVAALAAIGAGLPAAALAQGAWPSAKPVRIIVAFAPGSGNDLIARMLAPKIAADIGQNVIVENRAGAGGMIGTDAVAKAEPDGYTLGLGTSSQLVMNPALHRKMPFDIDRDLVTIGLISRTPLVLSAKKDGPADLKALLAAARANPGKLTYGSAGNGSITHAMGEHFKREAGVDLLHVPYKGNGPAVQDLIAGQIDMVLDGFSTSGPQHKKGTLRILGVYGKRHALYPDVPTFAEQGLPNFEAYTWNCLIAPRATPRPIVDRVNAALNKALTDPEIVKRFATLGTQNLVGSTPEKADEFSAGQRAKWVPAVRAMGVAVN